MIVSAVHYALKRGSNFLFCRNDVHAVLSVFFVCVCVFSKNEIHDFVSVLRFVHIESETVNS